MGEPFEKAVFTPVPAEAPEKATVPIRPPRTGRYLTLASLVVLLGVSYFYFREQVYGSLVRRLAQEALDALFTVEVERVGRVDLDAEGNLHLSEVELATEHRAERRVCFRADRVSFYFDGDPLRHRSYHVSRVDLHHPEIRVLRRPDGDWDALYYLRPRLRPGPERSLSPEERAVMRDNFPVNGVHVHHGTVLIAFRDSEGKEVEWRVENVQGSIRSGRGNVVRFEPFGGDFYGGRIEARAQIPSTDPFSLNLVVDIRGADVARMSSGAPFLKRPVNGRLDAVFSSGFEEEKLGVDPVVAGWAEVKDGDLWEFPALLGVLNALSLGAVSERKVSRGEILFTMKENRIQIDQLDFQGTPLTLYGDGYVDLTGQNLEIVFVPRVNAGLRRLLPIIGEPVQALLDIFMGAIVPVTVKGSWAEVESAVERERPVSEPVKELIRKER